MDTIADDRADPNHHAQQGQGRAQLVDPYLPEGNADGFEEDHERRSASTGSSRAARKAG